MIVNYYILTPNDLKSVLLKIIMFIEIETLILPFRKDVCTSSVWDELLFCVVATKLRHLSPHHGSD